MLRQFFKDSAIYGATSLLSQGISLLLLPLYTRVLSPTDYGIVDILTVFAALVNLTIALEISQGLARYFADAKTDSARTGYASTALWFTAGVYTLFAAIAYLSSAPLSQWLLEAQAREGIFRIAVLSLWGNGIFYLALNQLRWQLQPKLYGITSLVFTLVAMGVTVTLVLGFGLGVSGVLYGQLVGNSVGAALSLYFARHSYRLVFDWAKCKEMLRFSLPLVPSSVGVFVTLYIDRIAIKELMSLADVGLFGLGYRLSSLVSLLMVGFQGALTPLIYTHYRNPEAPQEVAQIFRYFVALALLLFLGLSLFAREILMLFTTPDYYGASVVVPLLVPALLLSNMYIFAPGLGIAKKTGTIAVINIVGAILNTALNLALVPILGIQGAALATLLSAAAIFLIYMAYSQKLYFVPHSWRRPGLAVLVTIGVVCVSAQVNLTLWVDIAIKSILVCITAMVFVSVGLVETGEMRRLWHRLSHLLETAKA